MLHIDQHFKSDSLVVVVNHAYQGNGSTLMANIVKRSHENSPNLQTCRADRDRRKALKLLIILIIEFFICWTPLYVYHTIGTFYKRFYGSLHSIVLDIILLLSFVTTSCNPITYYFMSQRYRSVLYANITWLYRRTRNSVFIGHDHHNGIDH